MFFIGGDAPARQPCRVAVDMPCVYIRSCIVIDRRNAALGTPRAGGVSAAVAHIDQIRHPQLSIIPDVG